MEAHPPALRPRSRPRHLSAIPDEPWQRRSIAEYRTAGSLEPAGERKIEPFGWTFAPGDKVMQID